MDAQSNPEQSKKPLLEKRTDSSFMINRPSSDLCQEENTMGKGRVIAIAFIVTKAGVLGSMEKRHIHTVFCLSPTWIPEHSPVSLDV